MKKKRGVSGVLVNLRIKFTSIWLWNWTTICEHDSEISHIRSGSSSRCRLLPQSPPNIGNLQNLLPWKKKKKFEIKQNFIQNKVETQNQTRKFFYQICRRTRQQAKWCNRRGERRGSEPRLMRSSRSTSRLSRRLSLYPSWRRRRVVSRSSLLHRET